MAFKKNINPIFVTQPSLPPLKQYMPYLQKIWKSKILTNGGKFHEELEKKLCDYLGVKYISLFTNGTLALMVALKSLEIKGDVITTPYSFVATTNVLKWLNINPIFVDIEPKNLTLDPKKVEKAITGKTGAILPVHVYGYPCKVKELEKISKKYNIPIIYDAAHAFGVKLNNTSILNFGNLSILSFHATKIFNTFEGGAIISHDQKTKEKIDQLKNFGFTDEISISLPGINAKMNELQASMGLLQLQYVDSYILKRKQIIDEYRRQLKNIPGITFLQDLKNVKHNYSYFPIFIDDKKYGKTRDEIQKKLKENNILTRRYFYPLISQLDVYHKNDNLLFAQKLAMKVLCLPVFTDLKINKINNIIKIIKEG